jgi:hypothetical protein
VNDEALAHWGAVEPKQTNKQTDIIYTTEFYYNKGFFILLFTYKPPTPFPNKEKNPGKYRNISGKFHKCINSRQCPKSHGPLEKRHTIKHRKLVTTLQHM